jgi:hypothetical protein
MAAADDVNFLLRTDPPPDSAAAPTLSADPDDDDGHDVGDLSGDDHGELDGSGSGGDGRGASASGLGSRKRSAPAASASAAADDKKAREKKRIMRNRELARVSNERRKGRIKAMEAELVDTRATVTGLEESIRSLEAENNELKGLLEGKGAGVGGATE